MENKTKINMGDGLSIYYDRKSLDMYIEFTSSTQTYKSEVFCRDSVAVNNLYAFTQQSGDISDVDLGNGFTFRSTGDCRCFGIKLHDSIVYYHIEYIGSEAMAALMNYFVLRNSSCALDINLEIMGDNLVLNSGDSTTLVHLSKIAAWLSREHSSELLVGAHSCYCSLVKQSGTVYLHMDDKQVEVASHIITAIKQFNSDESALDSQKQVGGNHYKENGIEPVTYCLANKLGFCEGNIIKYITRYKSKNGKEDLLKVINYAQRLINEHYGE